MFNLYGVEMNETKIAIFVYCVLLKKSSLYHITLSKEREFSEMQIAHGLLLKSPIALCIHLFKASVGVLTGAFSIELNWNQDNQLSL